jgi:hypothetical protein
MGYIDSHGKYIPNHYLEKPEYSGHHSRHHSRHHSEYHDDRTLFLPSHLLLIFIGMLVFFGTILIITSSNK